MKIKGNNANSLGGGSSIDLALNGFKNPITADQMGGFKISTLDSNDGYID